MKKFFKDFSEGNPDVYPVAIVFAIIATIVLTILIFGTVTPLPVKPQATTETHTVGGWIIKGLLTNVTVGH